MKFKLPEDLSVLSVEELTKLRLDAVAESSELAAKSDDEVTVDDLKDFESLTEAIDALDAETDGRETAEKERTDRLAAAREKLAAQTAEDDADGNDDADEGDKDAEADADADDSTDEDADAKAEEKEPIMASGKSAVSRTRSTKRVVEKSEDEEDTTPKVALVAAANVPGTVQGTEFADLRGVAQAFTNRTRGFNPKGAALKQFEGGKFGMSDKAVRMGLAQVQKPENEFSIDAQGGAEQMDIINAAAKESRLPGGSLVAAGGWCAPSETQYGFCSVETVDGILSIPEVSVRRGGINFTKGPDYGTLAADWGFLQTEAEAEAGEEKECYVIECPPFTDIRLDAIGFCVTNGILTNVGYPELTARVLEIGAVAHAHKVNAQVISRISTLLGTAVNYTEVGGAVTDLLNAIELNAEVLRYRYSLAIGATLEVVLPAWARLVARQDLANRNGNVSELSVTDAQINAWFSARGLAVQWVYDYQPLPTTGTPGQALPTTVQALIYPAGAFVKGTADVIDLDAIYDSVNISTNTYLAAFFEEGLLVANTCAGGVKVEISGLNVRGASGYPSIGAVAGVAFAPPA